MSEQIVEEPAVAPEDEPILLPADDDFLFDDTPDDEPDDTAAIETQDLTEDELRARLARAEKAAAFERDLRVKTASKSWTQEAVEHFPYCQPEKISASSRRDFLRQAKEQDQDFRVRAAPLIEKLEVDREAIRAEERAAAEASVGAAWGRPTTGTASGPVDEAQTDQRLERAHRRGMTEGRGLLEATKALMDGRRI